MEEHRELLDLPDELLIRILAGAGGMGVGAAAISCRRLRNVAARLHTLPVFSSALSTKQSLQAAIKDAGQRALSGCFGECSVLSEQSTTNAAGALCLEARLAWCVCCHRHASTHLSV